MSEITTTPTETSRSKIVTCRQCGCIHPLTAPCKPWGDEGEHNRDADKIVET